MYFKFNKLPATVKERLRKRLRGEGECVAIKTGVSPGFSYLLIGLAACWFVALYFLTNNYLWSAPTVAILSLLTLGAAYLLAFNLYKVVRSFASPTKSYLLVTPNYLMDVSFNDIERWNLDEILTIDGRHSYPNGKYAGTKFSLSLAGADKTFEIKNIDEAQDILEKIEYLHKTFFETRARGDNEYLNSNDDFRDLRDQTAKTDSRPRIVNIFSQVFSAIIALLLTVATIYAALALNNYFDDKKSWEAAQATNRAAPVRKYLETHPLGRWRGDAGQRLEFLYDAAEQKYKASLQEGYDQKAADAVLSMLRYARSSQNFRVKVSFERDNKIPPDIAEQLQESMEVKTVLKLHDALSNEKLGHREGLLLAVVSGAFGRIIPDDVLEFSAECVAECVNFQVKYTLDAGDSIYYPTKQEKLSDDERTYYPGIFISWDFRIDIPDQPQDYKFELKSLPSNEITYDSVLDEATEQTKNEAEILTANKSQIYDAMITSAFNDFQASLIFKMGIGDDKGLNIKKQEEIDKAAESEAAVEK